MPGVLNNALVIGAKCLLIFSTKPKSDNSFVKKKNGNNAGTKQVAHTYMPFRQASMFDFGLIENNIMIITSKIDSISFCLFKVHIPLLKVEYCAIILYEE